MTGVDFGFDGSFTPTAIQLRALGAHAVSSPAAWLIGLLALYGVTLFVRYRTWMNP